MALVLKVVSSAPEPVALGPGLHATHLEAIEGARLTLRTLQGEPVAAEAAPGVQPQLLAECLRSGRLVIASEGPQGALVLGALQTDCGPTREPDGTLVIDAERLRLRGEHGVELQSGCSSMKLRPEGKISVSGHRMVMDINAHLKVLSQLVELP